MHPTISYQLAQARIADLRHHAQQDTLARAARRARPASAVDRADFTRLPHSSPTLNRWLSRRLQA